ncbi:MAG: 23S rRNA (uracil(1939)-C(5))-methyltransferase RlmD [Acidobacteria bacterium]|nr:23S rRNA (uracil(1939)-C(5))-methyltransferase RlmD [Acidobacteriota bacterium]
MSAPLSIGALVDLDITDIAFGGSGVARYHGFVVMVPRSAPGDRVRARVSATHPTYAEGRIEAILDPSPDRIAPRCSHFPSCGGCAYQHIATSRLTEIKAGQVRETLRRLGGLHDVQLLDPIAAPSAYAYRNRIELTPLQDSEGRPCLGYHSADNPSTVFPVRECPIARPVLEKLRERLDGLLRLSSIRPFEPRTGRGYLRRVVLRSSVRDETLLEFWTTTQNPGPLMPLVKGLRQHPGLRGIVQVQDRGIAREPKRGPFPLWGKTFLREEILGLRLDIPAGSFAQTHSAMSGVLYEEALSALGEVRGEACLDLFCGVGALSILAERRGAREVVGVEVDPAAAQAASNNARRAGCSRCRFVQAEAGRTLEGLGPPLTGGTFSRALLNPPRNGLTTRTLEHLVSLRPERLVYISCNPATLARDLRGLVGGGYALEHVRPLDLFPQTAHVETVATLSRA